MFDIGFWEISLIAVVALLVVGPDEFPALVRNIGHWIGKIRSFMAETKNDLEQEFARAEALKKLIEKESSMAVLHEQIDARKINVESTPTNKNTVVQAANVYSGIESEIITEDSSRNKS